jgi:hypothetical protein
VRGERITRAAPRPETAYTGRVPQMPERERREFFGVIQKQLSSRYDCCLWPGGDCASSAIRAHSIQNRRVLDLLCADGHVIMPRLEASLNRTPRTHFRRIGRKQATTFAGLCGSHDQHLFGPLDTVPIDLLSQEQLFLLAYRAALQESHATRKAAVDTQTAFLAGAEKGLYPKDEPTKAGLHATNHLILAYITHEATQHLGQAYLKREWDQLEHTVLHIDGPPSIAVNAMISTDLYSGVLDAAAYTFLNVFPVDNGTVAIFAYLRDERVQSYTAYGDVWDASGDHQKYLLSKLVLRKCSNFVIAPRVFDTFSESQIEAMRAYFDANIHPRSADLDDSRLFLFGAC